MLQCEERLRDGKLRPVYSSCGGKTGFILQYSGRKAGEGAEQCGFCNPGFIMNIFAMEKELSDPTEEEINEYLAGNLCRCSGFIGQTRSILKYLEYKKTQKEKGEGE